MAHYRLTRGFDIPLTGNPAAELAELPDPATAALTPSVLRGVKLRLLVNEGDTVKIGTPLLQSKDREDWVFPAPAAGIVKEIRRGHRRVLEAIVIDRAATQDAVEFDTFPAEELTRKLSHDVALKQLMASGLLCLFRERPFDFVANPGHQPRDIFISTFDSGPLAPDLGLVVKDNEAAFQAGLDVCRALTSGEVHLGLNGRSKSVPDAFTKAQRVQLHTFSGPHPAGCVGVQIHHVKPVRKRQDIVWYTTVQGVILIGRLFLTGRIDPRIVVGLTGSGARERKHFQTVLGAPIADLAAARQEAGEQRWIAGNVLTGRKLGNADYLGFYDHQVTLIPEAAESEFCGWMLPGLNQLSWFRGFLSKLIPGRRLAQDTRLHGGRRAMVVTGAYDAVLPMNILPEYLIKSCLAQDLEEMEQLGIYEVSEEEFALCEYICPSKTEIQAIIRSGLELMVKES